MTIVTSMRIALPVPPSVNDWKDPHPGRRVGMHKSVAFRRYTGEVQIAWAQAFRGVRPLEGPVALEVWWHRARRAGDLDGRLKALCDALNGLAYRDDEQIEEIHAYRCEDPARPRVEVTIRALRKQRPDAPRPAPQAESGPRDLRSLLRPATYRGGSTGSKR